MKKGYVLILTAMLVLSMTLMVVNAAERQVKLDPVALGVKQISGPNAKAEDYTGEGIVNLRCNYSGTDTEKKFLWLGSNWTTGVQGNPSSLKIGNYNMAEIKKIEFDYTTDKLTVANRVSLTKDAAGTQKLASVDITEGTGALNHTKTAKVSMTITDTTYKGDMYLYIEYKTGESSACRMYVANATLTLDTASEPGTKNPSTGDTTHLTTLAAVTVLGILTVIKRKAGYGI